MYSVAIMSLHPLELSIMTLNIVTMITNVCSAQWGQNLFYWWDYEDSVVQLKVWKDGEKLFTWVILYL